MENQGGETRRDPGVHFPRVNGGFSVEERWIERRPFD